MMEDDFPVDPFSIDGSTIWSTEDFIASEISANLFGVASPEMFAEVETIGRPSRETSC